MLTEIRVRAREMFYEDFNDAYSPEWHEVALMLTSKYYVAAMREMGVAWGDL